jgi:hypothetical protein
MQRNFTKKYFPFYGGKCLPCKTFHNWAEKFSQGSSKIADDARPDGPVKTAAQTTVKRLLCCGFRHTGKVIRKVYQGWWRTFREINVLFPVSDIICFAFYIKF